jgi:hypothetical protein
MEVAPAETLFDEITDFLLLRPTPEQIISFQASELLNERLHELLDKNREEGLNSEESAELESFLKIGHLLTILKAKARLKLAGDG